MVQRRGGKLRVQRREGKTDGRKEGGKGVGEDCWYKEGGGRLLDPNMIILTIWQRNSTKVNFARKYM